MRTLMIVTCIVCLLAAPALAEKSYDYQWFTDGATILGNFADCDATLSQTMNRPSSAGYALQVTKTTSASQGYATAFLALVWGLQEGDVVTASFWRHDPEPGYPRLRLWAHYNDALGLPDNRSHDTQVVSGLAYGDMDFGAENGWDNPEWAWTMPAGHSGLVVDVVVYGDPGDTVYLDDLQITIPNHAVIQLPMFFFDENGNPVAAESRSWSGIKALFQ